MCDVEGQIGGSDLVLFADVCLEGSFLELDPEGRFADEEGSLREGLQVGAREGPVPIGVGEQIEGLPPGMAGDGGPAGLQPHGPHRSQRIG